MGINEDELNKSQDTNQLYVSILKALKKKKVNVFRVDNLGRNCFHHAASVGNTLGIQFTVKVINTRHEKETGFKIPEGAIIPAVQTLLNSQTAGGVTPLMKAAEAMNTRTVVYLL